MVIFVSHISLVVSGRFEWILDGFGTFDILVITHSSTSFSGSLFSSSVVGTETLVAAGPRIWVVEKSSGRVGQQGFLLSH